MYRVMCFNGKYRELVRQIYLPDIKTAIAMAQRYDSASIIKVLNNGAERPKYEYMNGVLTWKHTKHRLRRVA